MPNRRKRRLKCAFTVLRAIFNCFAISSLSQPCKSKSTICCSLGARRANFSIIPLLPWGLGCLPGCKRTLTGICIPALRSFAKTRPPGGFIRKSVAQTLPCSDLYSEKMRQIFHSSEDCSCHAGDFPANCRLPGQSVIMQNWLKTHAKLHFFLIPLYPSSSYCRTVMTHASAKKRTSRFVSFLLKISCTGFFLGDTKQ